MKEAKSPEHLLCHLPKNPFCDVCQRAKMQQSPGRRKTTDRLGPRLEKFGDQCTADHITKKTEIHFGNDVERAAPVICDRATGFIGAYPSGSKSGDDTLEAFKAFQVPAKRLSTYGRTTPRK